MKMWRQLSILSVLLCGTFFSIAQNYKYKIGDTHPNGFVFDMDPKTGYFWVVMPGEAKLNYADAVSSKKFGPAYADFRLPNNKQLITIYNNLAKKGIGNFKKEHYRSSEPTKNPSYPSALNFANGQMGTSALNNLTLSRGVKQYHQSPLNPAPKPAPTSGPAANNALLPGKTLGVGGKITSQNGKYIAKVGDDGNICIYQMVNGKEFHLDESNNRLWCSMTNGTTRKPGLQLTGAGNLILTDSQTKKELFNSNTQNLKAVKLVIENNGKLNLYNAAGKVVWTATSTWKM
ncbi:hypothetical protein [Niabella drilacis]|uniref:Bulb-type lectin domain-containing protein n=1 Tax=Niabella drilacis (strain DSM 25811 / CCM 8410 / CCUG 62505 / LMG 26954 / E90) TaxID=1285928 RepID=A0A1G6S6R0_NIADE|nr:hypothetical protein [Niabella drilacis]SDD12383.1 hypothetical protein SAMN04487894_106111 [Niabella drilacis]